MNFYGDEQDINVNRRVPEEGASAGADRVSNVIISGVSVYDRAGEELIEVDWPQDQWRCEEVSSPQSVVSVTHSCLKPEYVGENNYSSTLL